MTCSVIIVEDDIDIREAMAEVLRDQGHMVVTANEGAEALELLTKATSLPGLILLDLMMPVMDGIEFRQRQLADVRLRDIPVVLISADPSASARASGMGVAATFRKPISLATLSEIVRTYC